MSALDTSPRQPAPPRDDDGRLPAVDSLILEAITLVRMIHVMKVQHASRSAQALLFPLANEGPQRLSALAESVHTDPSTVSRQVAELVRDNLVRRDADPGDGRACLLAVTAAGHEQLARMRRERSIAMSKALADWSEEEIASFTSGLRRFSHGLAGVLGLPATMQSESRQSDSRHSESGTPGSSARTTVQEP